MAARVVRVYAKPSLPPIIVSTEVGQLVSSNSLDCGMEITKSTNRPTLKILNRNGEIVEVEDTSKKNRVKNYLVLRNKKKKKVSIYGTRTVFFKKPDCYKTKNREIPNLAVNNDDFNQIFGTAKAIRMSKSRMSNQEIVSTNILDNISVNPNMSQSLISASNEFAKYLPMGCDRFSNNIQTIYPVSTLLFDYEIDLMTDFAKEILNMLPLSNDNEDFSNFFITNINRLIHKTIKNICLLTFADGLVELLKTKPTDLSFKNKEIYPYSEVINDKLLDNFLEYNVFGGDLTSKMKDKAICHIIIIMVLINMNVVDLNWVSPYLNSRCQKRMLLLKRVVGITQLKGDKTKYTLKLPLPTLPSLGKLSKKNKLIT